MQSLRNLALQADRECPSSEAKTEAKNWAESAQFSFRRIEQAISPRLESLYPLLLAFLSRTGNLVVSQFQKFADSVAYSR